jgi:hypothetical protein
MTTYDEKTTPFNWVCPVCNQKTTITDVNYHHNVEDMYRDSKDGHFVIAYEEIICPNPDCNEANISTSIYNRSSKRDEFGRIQHTYTLHKAWQLIPSSNVKKLHEDVPQVIIQDYEESADIVERSPKAAATLARRALQGMIRDFFRVNPNKVDQKTGKVHKKRLIDEIDEIKPKTDPIVWQAINAVRELGAIGAHMEEDVNMIVDVNPQEAEALLKLIEFLSKEWYQKRLQQVTDVLEVAKIAKNKKLQKDALQKLHKDKID